MTLDEIVEKCKEQQRLQGKSDAWVTFNKPGRWGKRVNCYLWPHGPLMRIVAEDGGGYITVMGKANEVLDKVSKVKV